MRDTSEKIIKGWTNSSLSEFTTRAGDSVRDPLQTIFTMEMALGYLIDVKNVTKNDKRFWLVGLINVKNECNCEFLP